MMKKSFFPRPRSRFPRYAVAGLYLTFGLSTVALAAAADLNTGATGLCTLINSFVGKFLTAAGALGLIGSLFGLLAGAELSEGFKKILGVVAIVSLIMASPAIVAFVTGAQCNS